MKILMIGGTGLLGSEAARELIARGHTVRTLALPPLPPAGVLPPELDVALRNYLDLTDDELRAELAGCEGFVFAAGIDERVEGPAPIYELFAKYNIAALDRMLRIAKQEGVRRSVVFGSYFAYFDKLWPAMHLAQAHPYIRSRRDQERMALSYADDNFSVGILELPYIFGAQPGRKPVWVFLVEAIRAMKGVTLYPPGGTTMVTVRQVAQATAGALERTKGGVAYPIGWFNMRWTDFLGHVHRHMGLPRRRVVTVPTWLFRWFGASVKRKQRKAGLEGGLDLVAFADLQSAETFIDRSLGAQRLGVTDDDIDAAIRQSVALSLDVIDGRVETVAMKAE